MACYNKEFCIRRYETAYDQGYNFKQMYCGLEYVASIVQQEEHANDFD